MYNFTKPIILCLLMLIYASTALASTLKAYQVSLDSQNFKVQTTDNGTQYVKTPSGTLIAGIDAQGAPQVQPGQDGLTVDATGLAKVKKPLTTRFYPKIDVSTLANQQVTVKLTASANRPAQGRLFIEGQVAGKHYWKALYVELGTTPETYKLSQHVPSGVQKLWVRFDCVTPAIYHFKHADIEQNKQTMTLNHDDQMINGGAEQGWYGTSVFNLANAGTNGQRNYRWNGVLTTKNNQWAIDTNIRHSGQRSFRGDCVPHGEGRLVFAPVDYRLGKPACLSVWLKSKKPKARVTISLFLASGIAYMKTVVIHSKWARYDLTVPVWGKKTPGVSRIGNVTSGYGTIFQQAYPMFDADSTIWVDDVQYVIGTRPPKWQSQDLWLRGRANKKSHYYVGDQPASLNVQVQNSTEKACPVSVSWDLLNYQGNRVDHGKVGSFDLAPKQTRSMNIPVDSTLMGPYNLVVHALDRTTNRSYQLGFYLGRIPKRPATLNRRLGVNVYTQQNVHELIPYLKDFSIGSVRLWSSYKKYLHQFLGVENIPAFHRAGFYVLFNVGYNYGPLFAPKNLKPWQAFLRKSLAPVAGMVDCYEILNEPNIWNGRSANPDPSKYVAMSPHQYVRTLQAAAQTLHSIDPGAKIGGPTTCHTDVSYTGNVLADGGGKYLDIITEHPYRQLPELPDYGKDLQAMAKTIRMRLNKPIPYMATECGFQTPAILRNNVISKSTREAVALTVRNALIAFANHSKKYFVFSSSMTPRGSMWNTFYSGNPGNGYTPIPNPIMFAMRNLIDQIGNAPPAGRIPLGQDYRAYVFDTGSHRVVTLWKWHGHPAHVNLSGFENETKVFDVMGNLLADHHIVLGKTPFYIETTDSFSQIRSRLQRAIQPEAGSHAFAQTVSAVDKHHFEVHIKNVISQPLNGSVTYPADGAKGRTQSFKKLNPGDTAELSFSTPKQISTDPQTIELKTQIDKPARTRTVRKTLRSMFAAHVGQPIDIDGDLGDWPSAKPVVLTVKDNGVSSKQEGANAIDPSVHATVQTAWDSQDLYVAVVVFKENFEPSSIAPAKMYAGDSLQIAFDPLKNATPNTVGYENDDFEYSLGLFQGKPTVYRQRASLTIFDGLNKNLGVLHSGEVKLAVRTKPGKTVYEMAFPKASVSPFRLKAGNSMRWDVIANLSTGAKRIGWLQLTPGIGQSPKAPGQFMNIVLTDR